MTRWILLACAMRAALVAARTWTTQSPYLPSFEWVVLDHADGNSMGYGVTVAGGYVFTSGSMRQIVQVLNPETGAMIESDNEGDDGDIFLSKVALDGTPTAIWTYSGSMNEFPSHLATSPDDAYISMTGYFSGDISFGNYTFTNTKTTSDRDAFVVKVAVEDGSVIWARSFASDAGTRAAGTAFDSVGNIAVTMRRCELLPGGAGEECVGVITLLSADDGSTIWERSFGPAVGNLGDVVLSSDGMILYAVGSLMGTADFSGSLGVLSSANVGYSDALLLALMADTGDATWAGLSTAVSGTSDPTSSSALVEASDGYVWMGCSGPCTVTSSSASSTIAFLEGGTLGGAVLKFDETTGEPLWAADAPSALGMTVAGGAVYVNTHSGAPMFIGDTMFRSMGNLDHYVMKINADGYGEWVLGTGGAGFEYVRRMASDPNGDIYAIGLTQSNPSYFDPIVLTTHTTTDGYDVFIAKLQTSVETLPSCKTNETTIDPNSCFMSNVCYDAGEYSRIGADKCKYCDPSMSQKSLDAIDLTKFCLIDGVCYADGERRQVPINFFATAPSACQYCNASASVMEWTMVDGYAVSSSGTCVPFFPELAGFMPLTDVSSQSMIDLDAKEIEEYSDAAEWDTALSVYENGGGGPCTAEDIVGALSTDPCYNKTLDFPKGNSVTGTGEIRTIYGFASSGPSEMADEPMWNLYRDYFDDDNYADTFIRDALGPDGMWSNRSDALRAEMSAKGAKYQAVWMYAIHEMEDAVAQCEAGNVFGNNPFSPAGPALQAWDAAWAYYAGSLEGADGSGKGYLLYDLAEKRCPQFGTCGTSGGAIANDKALMIAEAGQKMLLDGMCADLAMEVKKMVVQMTIPIVQGMVRYVYLADPVVNGGSCTDGVCTYDKAWAEGWAFAAAVLPQIASCDKAVADMIVANLDVDSPTAPLSDGYVAVKEMIESTYACMGITCADIGEYQDANGVVFEGMEACRDKLFAPIAGYYSSTNVSTHAMIDLDAKEIEEYSDAAEWTTALFVYENGGGGLCTTEDIADAGLYDSCFGKTTSDPKGNSIKGSGDIRTIGGFATSGRSKMSAEPMWNLYRDYYNDDNYADTFIRNAISPGGAWSTRSDALRTELSEKGAKYQAVWMYVIHEMEDAVADCRAGNIYDNLASNGAGDSPHAWDEAWAFYAGHLELSDGSGKGYLLYDLAEKRCPQFGTCGESGGAIANEKALEIANAGLDKILAADCDGVAEELNKMVVQMTIPLVQGLLRYVYLADPVVNGGSCDANGVCTYDKAWAEGWAFAAAVLPQIANCDAAVADLVVANLDVDAATAPLSDGYRAVKEKIESTYACLGITCSDVGEYQDSNGVVFEGMEGCDGFSSE